VIYFPEFNGSWLHWLTLLFAVTSPLFFLSEATGIAAFGYSKFATQDARWTLPSRWGMLLLYAPAALLFPVMHVVFGAPWTWWHLLIAAMGCVHFTKRCLEALYLHRYSGVTNMMSTIAISLLYSTQAILLVGAGAQDIAPEQIGAAFSPWLATGLVLWVLGLGGNLYHHWLLANLRQPGDNSYKVPTGGLFGLLACPHYTCELLGWLGYALVFGHPTAWALMMAMTCYLMGRSYKTVGWYHDKGLDVPKNWKRLIPYVY
jgi:very-long-chain enoyl-CoA reductase